MKPGDLVKIGQKHPALVVQYGLEVYGDWTDLNSRTGGRFLPGQIALVLESLEHQGGNGCKVLLPGDTVGWCGTFYLRVAGEE